MKWSERFATGVEALDRQHKVLFEMSEDYRRTLDEGKGANIYGSVLQSLSDYARAHFGIEERCMFRYECPVAERNAQAHTVFVETLAMFRHRFEAAGFSVADAQQLVNFVDEWLAYHIGKIDTQLKPYVEKARPHG